MARLELVCVILLLTVAIGLIVGGGVVSAQEGDQRVAGNESVRIGNQSDLNISGLGFGPHHVGIEVGAYDQNITLTLSDALSEPENPVFNRTYTFAPNSSLEITINEPGNYSGVVRTNSSREDFDPPPFDCNYYGTSITVFRSGSIDVTGGGTTALCTTITELNGTTTSGTTTETTTTAPTATDVETTTTEATGTATRSGVETTPVDGPGFGLVLALAALLATALLVHRR